MTRLIDGDAFFDKIENKYNFSGGEAQKAYGEVLNEIVNLDTIAKVPDAHPDAHPFVFPVKPGQTVYIVEFAGIVKVEIENVTWNKDGSWTANWAWGSFGSHYGWGRNIFLTHEEAENAMETFEKGCAKHVQIAKGIYET